MIVKKGENNKGVTLIELLIVLVIAVILVGAVYSLFITQHQSYSVQDQVAGAQQDARAALDIMARDIRMAGSLSGGDGFTPVNTFISAVTPDNGSASTGGTPATSPDRITVVGAAEEVFSGANPVTVCNVSTNHVTLGLRDPDTGACTGVAIDTFFDPAKVAKKYVAFEGVNHVYEISDKGTSTLTLNDPPPAYIENVGANVFLVKAITYSVTTADGGPGIGVLRRNDGSGAQPLAGDGINIIVEDLQFAYQVTGSNNWIYDTAAHTWPASNTSADIRMVRITLIVRTGIPDQNATGFFTPACEDRTTVNNNNPGCRRRVYTTVVKVRNLKS